MKIIPVRIDLSETEADLLRKQAKDQGRSLRAHIKFLALKEASKK